MNESAWERTRRKTRNKLRLLLLIICPLGVVAAILLFNNRDLIGPSIDASGEKVHSKLRQGDSLDTTADTKETTLPKEDSAAVGALPPVRSPAASEEKNVTELMAPRKEKKTSVTPSSRDTDIPAASPDSVLCCSEVLQPIACSLENRKDVVINLSLELFFTDVELRRAIRLRREDIKVMVLRTIRYQELSAIKIAGLETLLLKNIATIFEHSGITKVKIRNIQIEKAEHK